MKRTFLILSVFIAAVFFAIITQGHAAEYKGRIVDADTGEPIEGAVFNMRWQQWCMPGYDTFFDAKETLTDKDGIFSIKGPAINFSLICWTEDDPFFIAYKAGYVPIRNQIWFRASLIKRGFLDGENIVLKLRKVASSNEQINAIIHAQGSFPNRFQKILVKEINKERRRLKVDIIPEVSDDKE